MVLFLDGDCAISMINREFVSYNGMQFFFYQLLEENWNSKTLLILPGLSASWKPELKS